MPFIKELKIHGFKSFAREVKIPFTNNMNVIVGPNGSGKSNITDAICFVLGRLGSKSMRAKKLSNLIFAGTSEFKPAKEASVELVFDNSDKGFSLNDESISIKRIIKKSGQSLYKINQETKTRQEVLELMTQAGIDPHGFNLVLQGEIDSFVKMPSEKRREVIEEVAGISIYEARKQKSLKELDKTEQKIKEVSAILRERGAYLKNLEQERKQALKFKKLQEDLINFKASIVHSNIKDKKEKVKQTEQKIEENQKNITKIESLIEKCKKEIKILADKSDYISNNVQKSSGLEQERLNTEISDLRADLAGLSIKKQSYSDRLEELETRKKEIEESIKKAEKEIEERNESNGKSIKKELEIKKKELQKIEEEKRRLYVLKSSLNSTNLRIEDKEKSLNKLRNDYHYVFERIRQSESELKTKQNISENKKLIVELKIDLENTKNKINEYFNLKNEREKQIAILEKQNENENEIISNINSLDICPLCKTKITPEHSSKVISESQEKINKNTSQINDFKKELELELGNSKKNSEKIEETEKDISTRSQDILRLELIEDKKSQLRELQKEIDENNQELNRLKDKKREYESQLNSIKTSEHNYDSLLLEVQELERHQEKNLGVEVTMKQREIERMNNLLKQISRENEENSSELEEVNRVISEKKDVLEKKNKQDIQLKEKFKKQIEQKRELQEKINFFEKDILSKQIEKQRFEDQINLSKIEKAQFNAQKESFEQEFKEFKEPTIIKLDIDKLKQKVFETQDILNRLGNVNMRALEVYDSIKEEYEKINNKIEVLLSEKQEILKVIEDIDKKKKKVFLQTLKEINSLFSRNFSQLSTKGEASLEIENKEDLFEAGLEMLIKVGKGKYFDTQSLSGGEQTLISLSLIFAIQEFKPYPFYIFDEIDAALDKHNSERLASLLKKYMKDGQYLIITHNDALITEASTIYGVSMQDKISKVISLEI